VAAPPSVLQERLCGIVTLMNRKYDAIVMGGGQTGSSLAARIAGAGQSVAIIEVRLAYDALHRHGLGRAMHFLKAELY
jgi:choline dehydrogenase-like flavoprotein